MSNKIKQIDHFIRSPLGIILILLCAFVTVGAGWYVKSSGLLRSYLNPGPLSATHPKDQPLEGFVSHAEFENQCTHCHAPVHCLEDASCQECHHEIAQQRQSGQGLHSRLPGTDRCQNCHIEHRGAEVVITDLAFANVDHQTLAHFSLERHQLDYQGQAMDCESCHSQDRFADHSLDCITCHVEEDHDYMAQHIGTFGMDCVPCHDGADRMADFEHDSFYVLGMAHEDTPCEDCHVDQVFAGTPGTCVECHEEPEMHAGQFGLDCSRCHNAVAWSPALLTRHTFYLDHGADQTLECQTCHMVTCTENTCYQCHDHTEDQMAMVHLEEGLEDYQNCAECHPTGQSGEAAQILELLAAQNAEPITLEAQAQAVIEQIKANTDD